ncbi:hypothetical protein B2G50_02205 [Leptospira interrogans serovar Canicola]|nr:hypothetical protein B2G50_02205 [Leptospira interrogans serovar Canicola]
MQKFSRLSALELFVFLKEILDSSFFEVSSSCIIFMCPDLTDLYKIEYLNVYHKVPFLVSSIESNVKAILVLNLKREL